MERKHQEIFAPHYDVTVVQIVFSIHHTKICDGAMEFA